MPRQSRCYEYPPRTACRFLRAQAVRIVLVGIACRAVRIAGEPIPRVIAIRFAVMRTERTGRVVGVGIRHRAADRNRRKLPGVVVYLTVSLAIYFIKNAFVKL